jgi:hypothetical protein
MGTNREALDECQALLKTIRRLWLENQSLHAEHLRLAALSQKMLDRIQEREERRRIG